MIPPFFTPWQLLYTDSRYASLEQKRGSLRQMNLQTRQGVLVDFARKVWEGSVYRLQLAGFVGDIGLISSVMSPYTFLYRQKQDC